MTKRSGTALALVVALLVAETATAADQYSAPPRHRGADVAGTAPYPLLLPPCRDSFWGVLLHCVPREEVFPSYDDLYAQNQIRSLRPPKRKPYIQVFSW